MHCGIFFATFWHHNKFEPPVTWLSNFLDNSSNMCLHIMKKNASKCTRQDFLLSAVKKGEYQIRCRQILECGWHEIIIFQFGASSAHLSRSRSQRNFNVFFLSAVGASRLNNWMRARGSEERRICTYRLTEHLRVRRRLQVAQLFHQQKVNALLANPLGP